MIKKYSLIMTILLIASIGFTFYISKQNNVQKASLQEIQSEINDLNESLSEKTTLLEDSENSLAATKEQLAAIESDIQNTLENYNTIKLEKDLAEEQYYVLIEHIVPISDTKTQTDESTLEDTPVDPPADTPVDGSGATVHCNQHCGGFDYKHDNKCVQCSICKSSGGWLSVCSGTLPDGSKCTNTGGGWGYGNCTDARHGTRGNCTDLEVAAGKCTHSKVFCDDINTCGNKASY